MDRKNSLRRIVSFIAGLILIFSAISLEAQQQIQLPADMVVTNRFCNIRKGPGTGYDKLTTLYKDDRIRAERKYRNWLRVLIPDGRIGWVREDLVKVFSVDDLPLTDEQADSLKEVVESQQMRITEMEDSSLVAAANIGQHEGVRDSLMNLLSLAVMPNPDSTAQMKEKLKMDRKFRRLPGRQESVLGQSTEYPRRFEFSPLFGVVVYDGDAMPAAGFNVSRNFTRELACRGQVAYSRLGPPVKGSIKGDMNRVFFTGGLVYSYRPGRLFVPFFELGCGGAHVQAGDSSYTAMDIVFGAGARLFFTPDLAIKFGYQGHEVMAEGNQLMHLFYMSASAFLPPFEDKFPFLENLVVYIAPYVGYQSFSQRFLFNDAPVVGLRAGVRLTGHLAAEVAGAYLPIEFNDGLQEHKLDATQLRIQALYYFLESMTGPYLVAGGGTLALGGGGRSTSSSKYGSFHFGGGFNFQLSSGVSFRSEMVQFVYPNVAGLTGGRQVKSAGGLQLSAGLNLSF
ncbi:MAG: SH3 domain-containing protein [Gemmatimonadota bacterium]|nr:SH3 domain-containing protein [Gemmatimonadota bacterium]